MYEIYYVFMCGLLFIMKIVVIGVEMFIECPSSAHTPHCEMPMKKGKNDFTEFLFFVMKPHGIAGLVINFFFFG